MSCAPRPCDEQERLAALYDLQILDTAPDPDFEVYVDLAKSLFNAPICAISFVDKERQWFKAARGFDVCETSRDVSFCAHSILTPSQVLYVPDTTRDPRFATNPLVTEYGIRFYAGAPVCDPVTGKPLGALCVLDRAPRHVSPDLLDQLQRLARAVQSAIQLHRALHRLNVVALHDPLTGVFNRAAFEACLQRALTDSASASSAEPDQVALLFLDLDHFKAINDLFGHGGGDAALQEVARRLQQSVRGSDVIARLGGDEFCVLVEHADGRVITDSIAGRIHTSLAADFLVDGKPVPLRTSIGIAIAPADGCEASLLLAQADAALYAAKRSGQGTDYFEEIASETKITADQVMTKQQGRRSMEQKLHDALIPPGYEPFSLRYQPFFSVAKNTLLGFEALVRWPVPDGTELSPAAFIPVAETTGKIIHLDQWVLREACREAASWPVPLIVSTNLSAANFFATDIVEVVTDVLTQTGLSPERLKLEITESVLLRDPERVRNSVKGLQRLGVKIALDDFGSGHASLAYLRDYPIDEVKIDRSFVQGAEADHRTNALFQAMVAMCRALKVRTLAEGVETVEQLAMLRRHKVATVQGFLLGRPLSVEQARALVKQCQITPRRLQRRRFRISGNTALFRWVYGLGQQLCDARVPKRLPQVSVSSILRGTTAHRTIEQLTSSSVG